MLKAQGYDVIAYMRIGRIHLAKNFNKIDAANLIVFHRNIDGSIDAVFVRKTFVGVGICHPVDNVLRIKIGIAKVEGHLILSSLRYKPTAVIALPPMFVNHNI